MAGRKLSMRKTSEVLRLHYELKLGQRQIARSIQISQSTVHDYLARFVASGLSWPLPVEVGEAELAGALFPPEAAVDPPVGQRRLPDFAHIHQELQQHKHTTLQLLWKNTGPGMPRATVIAGFVITISNGSSSATW